jgi:hypothetical protein
MASKRLKPPLFSLQAAPNPYTQQPGSTSAALWGSQSCLMPLSFVGRVPTPAADAHVGFYRNRKCPALRGDPVWGPDAGVGARPANCPARRKLSGIGQSCRQPPFSARAATRGAREIGNRNPSRVSRPARALFPESARAATRGAREIGNRNPSRVSRPARALFPESRPPSTHPTNPL